MGRHTQVVGSDEVHVLLVCAANLCRSPLAEQLVRRRMQELGTAHVHVSSAGLSARPGTAMDPVAHAVLQERGLDGADFRTRLLDTALLGAADLVLVSSRRQRASVADLDPRAAPRTFTFGELARHARALDPGTVPPGTPVERVRALVELAAGLRGTLAPNPREDDLADPFRGGLTAMRACADELERCTSDWLRLVDGAAQDQPAVRATPGA